MNGDGRRTRETATEKQRRVWDAYAADYDRQIAFLERVAFAQGRAWIAERARGRTLDVGIGTGRNLEYYSGGVDVTGVDLSPEMLAVARRRAEELGRVVELREADAEQLPFADGTFDSAVCALSLCNIPDPVQALNEMRRVLLPGGRLLLLDHVASTWPPVWAVQWLVERWTVRSAGEHFTRRPLPLLGEAGFQVLEARRGKAGTVERVHAQKPA
jgi:ubiquinone/menaquinone biosynthesis C-methylase UbiE